MSVAAAVAGELRAAGEAFGLVPAAVPKSRWVGLMLALDDSPDDACVRGVELIYEGYLFHYRVNRLCPGAVDDRGTALLAGDFFYAHGLEVIAGRGNVASVALLARLMAACSYLRSAGAPFGDDDALWAYAVAGLVALRRGGALAPLTAPFDELEIAWGAGLAPDVVACAREAAARLPLPHAALQAELAGAEAPHAGRPTTADGG